MLAAIAAVLSMAPGPTANFHQRTLLDANWRFMREASAYPQGDRLNWTWRPTSGVTLDIATLPADLNEGQWLPGRIGRDVFRGRRGFAWFQTDLGVGPNEPNLTLHFESVDDNARVFLNGVPLAKHEGWDDPFDVPLASVWKPNGPNRLMVLVENTAGGGGIMGPVWLFSKKPEALPQESKPGFNDRAWRVVHLPHDYVVEGKFDPGEDNSHGSLPKPSAWYRKAFTLPAADKYKSVWVDFDGVYRNSTVYLNGHKLGNEPSGYIGFRYDIAPYANFGGRNVLAVHVDPRRNEGWWYEGGGIYRHVWLNVASPVHIQPWGVFVRSDVDLASKTARLTITTTIQNDSPHWQIGGLVSLIIGPHAKDKVRLASSAYRIPPHGRKELTQTANLSKVHPWSIDDPNLYTMVSMLSGGAADDSQQTPFGLRTIRFDKDRGFFLNGKPVKLKGTCNHQDFAGVGIGMPDGILEWRIKKLKEMGSNAYRCSHNPPAAELLDACDRLGMVVMDETRHLGDSQSPKSGQGTKYDKLTELKSLVMRDRNHPSVIMWSLENEEPLQGTPEGARIFTAMRDAVRKLDPTRPCSSAMNGGWGSGISLVEDLLGMNYAIDQYDVSHKRQPNVPMFGSETMSTVTTRGIYQRDNVKAYVPAYDINTVPWGNSAQDGWRALATRPWMAGGFVWTGFDYKGEPTPFVWPAINSHFGIMDMCGFPKDNYYYYKAWWGDKPVVHILPHWNWAGKEGQAISVWAYSNGDEVELLLNGKSLGIQPMPRYGHVAWSVPYQPGVLEARATRNGRLVATDRAETTGEPAGLRVRFDSASWRHEVRADGEDVIPVIVEVTDDHGRVVPTANNLIRFEVTNSPFVGVGNGNPSDHDPDKARQRHAFNGLCMVLVGGTDKPGVIRVRATSPGLLPAEIEVPVHTP